MPELTITAWAVPEVFTISRSHSTGAAFTWFEVKTPAAAQGAELKTMAMSVRPLYLMFASQEAARNPRAEVIPPSLMFIRPSPLR